MAEGALVRLGEITKHGARAERRGGSRDDDRPDALEVELDRQLWSAGKPWFSERARRRG